MILDKEFSTETLQVSEKVTMFKCHTCNKQLFTEEQAYKDHIDHRGKLISVRFVG